MLFPVVTPPWCLGGLGSHPNATSRPAGATSRGSANARARVGGKEETHGAGEPWLSPGELQRGDTTGEEERENDAK